MMQNRESLVNLCQIILRVVLLGRKFFSMWGMMMLRTLVVVSKIRRIFLHILKRVKKLEFEEGELRLKKYYKY